MSWQLLDKPQTLKVTKKLAREFAEMDPAPHDRALSERRLQVYQRLFKEGSFRPCTWAKALCVETEGVYRVNGKHTSTLLAGLGELPEFYVTVESYQCDTLEDVAKLYATFDSNLQSRTARDIYLSFAGTVPELREMPARTLVLAVTGMNVFLGGTYLTPSGSTVVRSQPAERAEALFDHPEFVIWLNQILSAGSDNSRGRDGRAQARHLMRAPVVGVMMGTWKKSQTAATEFWSAVRDETGESPQRPDRKLARYLLTAGVDMGGGTRRVKTVHPREMFAKCIHAWNAWRKQETTNLNYYADKDVPAIK